MGILLVFSGMGILKSNSNTVFSWMVTFSFSEALPAILAIQPMPRKKSKPNASAVPRQEANRNLKNWFIMNDLINFRFGDSEIGWYERLEFRRFVFNHKDKHLPCLVF
jgi:hypothetical protein